LGATTDDGSGEKDGRAARDPREQDRLDLALQGEADPFDRRGARLVSRAISRS